MKVRRRKRKRSDFESNADIISSLPIELIENILVKLPIKQAIRTSILSSRWKNKWTSIPHLVFEEEFLGWDLIRYVDMVLSVHQGPIRTFQVDYWFDCSEALERWLPILSQKGIKDLRLSFRRMHPCMIPSCLFSCPKLEHLEISDCILNAHDQCFQGFKFLRTLKLSSCDLIGVIIEKFVSSCPLLEILELLDFRDDACVVIRAPNLRKFSFRGWFNNISFETPNLVSVSIDSIRSTNGEWANNLWRALGQLPNIEELEMDICGMFIECLSSGYTQKKLPVTYYFLKKITMYLWISSIKGLEVTLSIFRSAPNLKTLDIRLPSQNLWEDQRITNEVFFKHLEVVKVLHFKDDMSMVGFAKYLLGTAPRLEKLIIDKYSIHFEDNGLSFLRKLASLPRLSTKAVILFKENC